MKASTRLIKATADILDAYNAHPFVAGIQNGDLDRAKFRFYIVQDYLYLKEYAKVFAVGVAKAKSLEVMRLFAKYIPVMDGELNVHEGYLARLGVTQEEVDAAKPAFANLAYTSYMLRVAYEEGDAETLTAILPCACRTMSISVLNSRLSAGACWRRTPPASMTPSTATGCGAIPSPNTPRRTRSSGTPWTSSPPPTRRHSWST